MMDSSSTLPSRPLGLVDCTNEQYHGAAGISKSHLDVMARSPAHYWQAYINPEREPREATPAMVLGTLIHSAILEPDLFQAEVVVEPDDAPARPSERQRHAKKPSPETVFACRYWDEFDAANAGKTIITPEQMAVALGARDSVHRHPIARQMLARGKAEQSFFAIDPDTGALVKCRTDWFADAGFILDVKSTEDASAEAFKRSITDYRYHVQPPWYHDVIEAALDDSLPTHDWFFLAVEKRPPFACALYTLPPAVYAAGRAIGRQNLQRIVDCKALDHWPAFPHEPTELQFSRWALDRMGANSPEAEFT